MKKINASVYIKQLKKRCMVLQKYLILLCTVNYCMFKPYLSEMDINIKDIHEGFSTYWITKTVQISGKISIAYPNL